jgi:hypothetical protein
MGQEILYCSKCQTRLLGSEFEKGKAFRIGDKAACAPCARELLAALPPREREAILAASAKDPRRTSSPSLQAIRPAPMPAETPRGGTRLATDSSTRIKTTVRRTAPAGRKGLYVGIGAVAAAAFAVIIALTVNRAQVEPRPAPHPPIPAAPISDPRPPATPKDPSPAEREALAKKSFQEAREFAAKNPADLSGQLEKFKKARWDADGTPFMVEAQKELDQVLQKIAGNLGAEMAPIEEQARGACGREEYRQAIDILEAARKRFEFPQWSALIDANLNKVREETRKAYAPLREEALKSRAAGTEARVREISGRVARWGIPELSEDLTRALAEKPPPATPPVPPALAAYRKRWEESLARLDVRDYGEAIRDLKRAELPDDAAVRAEHARDLEDLGLAAGLLSEALQALAKWPKGKPLKLLYWGEKGDPVEVSGTAGKADANQIEVVAEGGTVGVPLPEIAAASLVDVFKGRPEAKPEADARAVTAFLALEGDEGAARALGEKHEERTRRGASGADEKERAARGLFWAAENAFRPVSSRAEAVEKYLALLGEHGETAFVRRNRALIASRPEDAKEYFFFPHDLAAAGTFFLSPAPKMPSCMMSASDSPPEKGRDNYVEFEFYAPAEGALRCWIYAGACCAETFTFYAQVTDLTVPSPSSPRTLIPAGPGENASLLVKNPLLFLKKAHALHGGPKAPERWAWFEIQLPKFAGAGIKKARVLTDQQGFAVAYALVSPARKSIPTEAETREILKAHSALAPAAVAPPPTGTVLREFWKGISGHILSNLTGHPNFPNSPSGTSQVTNLEVPVDFGDDYGTRLRGYVHPPQTGLYTFWITGDDQYEFWLSTDDTPANKRKTAWGYEARGNREWKDEGNRKSAPVPLAAGRRYYVEVLHKEGGGGDHVSVGWKLPDGTDERPIPGTRLSPWGAAPAPPAAPGPAPKPVRAVFYRAINLNGPPLKIDNLPWEGKDAPNVTATGELFENQDVPLVPSTDANRARMIRASVFDRGGSAVKVTAVPKGTYQVFLWVWEDNNSQTFDLSVNGKVVQQKYSSGNAGHWEKLGPWTVEVSDGAIEVRATAADANFSGIEVWRVR